MKIIGHSSRVWEGPMYDPTLGRFLERAPAGFLTGDGNLYEYARGDPVDFIDPSGDVPEWMSRTGRFIGNVVVGAWEGVKSIPGGIKETGLILYDGGRLIGGKLPSMAANAVFNTPVIEPTLYSKYAGGAIQARAQGRSLEYFTDAATNTVFFGVPNLTKAIVGAAMAGDEEALAKALGQAGLTVVLTASALKKGPVDTRGVTAAGARPRLTAIAPTSIAGNVSILGRMAPVLRNPAMLLNPRNWCKPSTWLFEAFKEGRLFTLDLKVGSTLHNIIHFGRSTQFGTHLAVLSAGHLSALLHVFPTRITIAFPKLGYFARHPIWEIPHFFWRGIPPGNDGK